MVISVFLTNDVEFEGERDIAKLVREGARVVAGIVCGRLFQLEGPL